MKNVIGSAAFALTIFGAPAYANNDIAIEAGPSLEREAAPLNVQELEELELRQISDADYEEIAGGTDDIYRDYDGSDDVAMYALVFGMLILGGAVLAAGA